MPEPAGATERIEDGLRSRPPLAIVAGTDTLLDSLQVLGEEVRQLRAEARAASTVTAYQRDWRHFTAWCAERDLPSLPAAPTTLAVYLAEQARSYRPATIARRLVVIGMAHRRAGLSSPTSDAGVGDVWSGIRRRLGSAQPGKAPLLTADITALVAALPAGTAGTRDRALLLVGFAGAFRRSELVGLDVGDVVLTGPGAVVTVRRSKTDQDGAGQPIGLPRGAHAATCPVRALEAWLVQLGEHEGPIFRSVDRHGKIRRTRLSGYDVARIVKQAASRAGLDPARYAGHSLRAGLATAAAAAGVPEREIMAQTRHRSVTVARRYIRDGELFRRNAAASVGL